MTCSQTKLNRYIAILPFAFAVHNIEEAITIGGMKEPMLNAYAASQTQFIIAVLLFTILGFLIVFGKKLYYNNRHYQYVVTGFAGMLFLNSFFPHILSAAYFRNYTPGLISATLLILPLTSFILWKTYHLHLFSNKQLVATIALGGVIGIILVAAFLGIGYLFTL